MLPKLYSQENTVQNYLVFCLIVSYYMNLSSLVTRCKKCKKQTDNYSEVYCLVLVLVLYA